MLYRQVAHLSVGRRRRRRGGGSFSFLITHINSKCLMKGTKAMCHLCENGIFVIEGQACVGSFFFFGARPWGTCRIVNGLTFSAFLSIIFSFIVSNSQH